MAALMAKASSITGGLLSFHMIFRASAIKVVLALPSFKIFVEPWWVALTKGYLSRQAHSQMKRGEKLNVKGLHRSI